MISRCSCLAWFVFLSFLLVGPLGAAEPKKGDTKVEPKKVAKAPADVVGVIGEVKVIGGSPSAVMVEHGSRAKKKQPPLYQEFQIDDETKIEFEGFPKEPQPTLSEEQKVEITFKKGSKTAIARLVVHPKNWKPAEASIAKDAPKPPAKKPAKPKDKKK